MKNKLEMVSKSPKLYEKVVEQTHDKPVLLDENKAVRLCFTITSHPYYLKVGLDRRRKSDLPE